MEKYKIVFHTENEILTEIGFSAFIFTYNLFEMLCLFKNGHYYNGINLKKILMVSETRLYYLT